MSEDIDLHGVAIIGMSGRFPGADSIDEYWENISQGLDCTRDLTSDEIIESGVEPEVANSDSYIRRCADLNDIDKFDAAFFDYLPTEAKVLDPQARLFLECVQTALDDAGCDPDRFDGSIGVYAGTGLNNYLLKNIMRNPGLFEDLLDFQTVISNDKDFLSTQINYKFDLTGPGISVQTACSTSLVAIQLAYQSLLTYQCDVAVSGGTHIRSPRARGNPYKEGEIFSPDGYCRPFDKDASGTIFGEGAGVVVLKRLEDALADRDHIYGIIRGAAINNDGKQKVSYAAPSVKGQAEVVALAQTLAGLDADEIGYVEAHGTGTKLGDPIEIRALTQAFRSSTDKKNYCAIGSGKSMIGHLDVAAGVAGFIRASLALYHKTIPPTAHFVSPNPELKLDESPFYICSEATPWEGGAKPRIAAVSSFGVGGTNAHAIIQEAPAYSNTETKKNNHLLVLSAKTPTALDAQAEQLAAFFEKAPDTSIADAAYTLQMGRRQFPYRKVVVCDSTEQAIERLTSSSQTFTSKGVARQINKPVMFMFSGQGSQYINMCRDLYYSEAVFAECINTCAEAVVDIVGFDFIDVIFSDQEDEASRQQVKQTNLAQPALYAIECGLARLWSHYGIKAQAMIGHSIGEFAAACFSGVFSLEEGARIVAMRGKLMQQMQPGAMLGLRNAAEDVDSVLEDRNLSIVVINGPELTVVGGPVDDIHEFKAELEVENIPASLLHTSHAFHSRMMDDAVTPFIAEVSKYSLQKPKIPFISNVTGEWITPEQAVDPSYWGNQMRSPVQFSKGIETLCMDKNPVLLEVGPGQALSILCQQQAEHVKKCNAVSSARHPKQDIDDVTYFYRAYGTLWANGANVDLSGFYDEERRKVSLPSYPFERKSFWISSSLTSNFQAVNSQVVVNDSSDESPFPHSSEDITVSPDNSIEGIVTGVWVELLGCDDIQLSDNFFNLGGHSLVASQMLEKVEAICGRKVTLTMLNNSDTLGDFCAAIEALPGDDLLIEATKQSGETGLTSTTREQWSLSPQQERLWFYHEYSNTDPAYNLAQTIVVEGRINLEMLKEAVDHVLSIHEAFNTVFTYDGDWQVIANRSEQVVEASIQRLKGDSAEDQENELIELIIDHNSRAKDFVQETVNVVLYVFNDERIAIVLYMPHILTDGLSFNIFYQQVDRAYGNLIENRDVGTNVAAKYQYSDYVDWLSKRTREEEPQTLDYWREYLDGVPALIQLPTSHPRPAELSSLGAGLHFSLDANQSAKVKALCNKLNVTPFVFFLSQLYLTLWQHSGQTTHVVGAPYANRANEDLAGIVGFFVDMIPIRGDIKASTTFAEWVREIRQSFSEAWDNFKIGLDKIVEVSGVNRHPNAHPLFQVTFTYLSYLDNSLGNDDYSMRQVLVDRGVSEYDLSLYMWEEEEFLGLFEFASDLFTDKAIERLQEHFVSVIDSVLADSNRALSELPMITPADQVMISKVNATDRPEYLSQSFVELFSEAASQYPEKAALIYSGVTLSYQELNNATNALAAQLVGEGVGKGSYVGVFVSRGLNTLISLIAIFKAGAAYIPLDPNFPADRLRYIIENSEVNNILVDQDNQQDELLRTPNLTITVLDAPRTDSSSIDFVPIEIKPDDVAYMIYTSGSTGLPKGVPISHESLMNFLLSVSESPGIKESDRLLALTTTSFDISLLELLLPLVNGASVVIADSITARDPEKLAQLIETENITYMQATPVTWSLLFESGWYGKSGLKILSGGEALTKDLASKLLSSGEELWNAYGPTEATIWASFSKIEKVDGDPGIGLPMANTSFFVLNEHNRVVPPGVVGELAIGGVPLSPGYHKREELTNEAFIEINTPGKDSSERVYKTGDLALLTVDGDFRCLGRKDSQIKIRGFRIELGEIESTLLRFEDIRETACIVSERSEYDKQIVAYYKADSEIEPDVLIEFLEQYLPDYMVPRTYILLDEFPYTPNAKVDRKKLPAPDINEADISADDKLEQLSPAESKILEIWQELFNLQNIGVTDEFFKLGGNSLLGVRLINVMNDRLGNYWRINHLFTHPTIRKLAISIKDTESSNETVIKIRPGGSRKFFFIYDGEGEVMLYHNLANRLPKDFTVFGIMPQSRAGIPQVHLSVEEMAKDCIQQMKRYQSEGPYYYGGLCAGGVISFEMTAQLESASDKIGCVLLLEAVEPNATLRLSTTKQRIQRFRNMFLGNPKSGSSENNKSKQFLYLINQASNKIIRTAKYEIVSRVELVSVAIRLKLLVKVLKGNRGWPNWLAPLYFSDIYSFARDKYRAPVIRTSNVILAKATTSVENVPADEPESDLICEKLLGWEPFVDEITVLNVSGGHSSMLQEPYVEDLGEQLKHYLV